MPHFVQFMHPGSEAIPDRKTTISWNKNDHKRKFLKCKGTRLDENSNKINGEIVFWAEWEPESVVVRRIEKPVKDGPCYVYEPYYVKPRSYNRLQNTDPFVFGKEFRYSWCRQPRLRSLRELDEGSVILFGSHLKGKFVLDTVFVLSEHTSFKQNRSGCEALLKQVDETYKTVVLNPILMGKAADSCAPRIKEVDSKTYRSYRGVTFDERTEHHGMFSFFPCQAYKEDTLGFARSTIQMPVISNKMTLGIKITEYNSESEIYDYWEEVKKQVESKCSLGIFAEIPTERKVAPE